MTQPGFVFARDSHVLEPVEIQRLSGQNDRILAALRAGPKTARDLAAISLKYTSRISDLRKAGYVVRCDEKPGGLSVYSLAVVG